MTDLLGGKSGEQKVGAQVRVARAGAVEQVTTVLTPEGVRAGAVARAWRAGLREQYEIELSSDQSKVGPGRNEDGGLRR
jgi:sulfate adenylyltransferase subunit 1 (EFTu-like GTPase family)